MNLATTLEQTSSLIEELAKTYAQIEAEDDASCDKVEWKVIEGHFRQLQSVMKKKLEDLEAKETDVTEKEKFLSEREATITAKEQDVLDKVQELKDGAMADIMEVKVNCYVSDENGNGCRAQAVAEELTQFCERMDSKGLLNYVTKNLNNLSHVCRRQLPMVFLNASEPTRLVLDAVEGLFPPDEMTQHGEDSDVSLHDMRQSCLLLLEAFSAFMAKSDPDANSYLTPETKQHAKAIADDWKPKLALESIDASNGKSLEARAFLRLLVTFKIASEFDVEELCKCVLATAHHKQASQLSRSLELSEKVPGFIETLLKDGKNMEAVNFIMSFKLSESYPPVPLLKTYLKDVRRNLQGNGLPETQNDFNARELTAVKAVMRCVKDYKLEDEFPLDTLRKRFGQLQSSVRDKRRNKYKGGKRDSHSNRGGSLEPEVDVSENGRQDLQVCGESTQYPSSAPNAYDYQVSNQYAHAQANDPNSYDYRVSNQYAHAQANDPNSYDYRVSNQYAHTQANDPNSYYHVQGGVTSAAPYQGQAPVVDASLQPPQYPYV